MKKILLLNVGWSNKGNLALWTSTVKTIRYFVPDAEFNFVGPNEFTFNGYIVRRQLAVPSVQKPKNVIISLLYLIEIVFINLLKFFGLQIPISKKSGLFLLWNCDVVINSGGDHLSGESGIGTLGSLVTILYAIMLGKPVILYGDSLGYFKNSILNSFARLIFNRTKLILLRERLSKKYLNNNNVTSPRICVTADPAFILIPAPKSRVLEILSAEGLNTIHKPIIGVNPSGLIQKMSKSVNHAGEEKVINAFAKAIDYLVEKNYASILMIPHVYTQNVDDRNAINEIYAEIKNKSKVGIIKNEYAPDELKGIIGLCDLFIGARMHATIASTSMLIPTIGIAYSHKMHGIIGEMLGQEKYILNINELNNEVLISKANDAWVNREDIKKELAKRIPIAKKKAMLNGKLVKELLE